MTTTVLFTVRRKYLFKKYLHWNVCININHFIESFVSILQNKWLYYFTELFWFTDNYYYEILLQVPQKWRVTELSQRKISILEGRQKLMWKTTTSPPTSITFILLARVWRPHPHGTESLIRVRTRWVCFQCTKVGVLCFVPVSTTSSQMYCSHTYRYKT